MDNQKLYLDTSIISAYFDFRKPVRQLVTQKWLQYESSNFDIYISTLVLQEIDANSNIELKQKMTALINEYGFSILGMNDEAMELSELYRQAAKYQMTALYQIRKR